MADGDVSVPLTGARQPAFFIANTAWFSYERMWGVIERYKAHYLAFGGAFVAYTGVSLFSSYMYHVGGTAPAILIAPQGIALAAALLLGYAAIPVTAVGSLVAGIAAGNPLPIVLMAVAANILQPALTLLILDRIKANRALESSWDFYRYIIVAFITSAIVPTVNFWSRELYNSSASSPVSPLDWSNVWIAGLVSVLILTPFLVRVGKPLWIFTKAELVENIIAVAFLAIPTLVLTFTPVTTFGGISLLIPFCIFLLWIALRGGTFFVTLGMLLVSVAAISGRILGHPANPQNMELSAQIVNAEVSLIVFALIFYLIASLEESRRAATLKLQAYSAGLEKTVTEKELDVEAKNEFISMLGHEIRNPLASLLSSIELLKVGDGSGLEQEKIVDTMEERIRSMSRLLDDMFDISRLTRNGLRLKKENVEARAVLRRAAETVDHQIIENRHRFSMTLPESRVLIEADPVRIEQIVTNLLSNAAKYTPRGGTIELISTYDVDENGGTLVIRVKASGIGLTREERAKIFEPFVQINPTQSVVGGIGLGLALARSLALMHGGTIEAQSAGRGRGSELIVRMPAWIGKTESAKDDAAEASPALPGEYSILVADDNVTAADGLCKLLSHYGYKAYAAYNGSEVIEKIKERRPDAILLDIGLPDMDGFEVARRLAGEGKAPLLIALSGYGEESHREKAREAGFNHYLTKPVSVKDIIGVVSALDAKS